MHITSTWTQTTPISMTTTQSPGEDREAFRKRHRVDMQSAMEADDGEFASGSTIRSDWPLGKPGGEDSVKTEPEDGMSFEEVAIAHEEAIAARWVEYPPS